MLMNDRVVDEGKLDMVAGKQHNPRPDACNKWSCSMISGAAL